MKNNKWIQYVYDTYGQMYIFNKNNEVKKWKENWGKWEHSEGGVCIGRNNLTTLLTNAFLK